MCIQRSGPSVILGRSSTRQATVIPAAMLMIALLPRVVAAQASRVQVEDRSSRASAFAKGIITFDDLKFDLEKGGKFDRKLLTDKIESLHKKTVELKGYILPTSVFRQTGIEEFVLVRDNMECCFGPGAALYDCVIVRMAKGKTATFTTRPVTVKGKFEIKEFLYPDSDEHYAIYQITATEVK
ncbi:MAG: DUF3299 domain-containing protein [Planctomycetota bacterium]|nr:MAG: DUF3299 domain-containing protein [Planctomycetota bacterium]